MCKEKNQTVGSAAAGQTYSKELYNACKYMYGHPEEFKEYEIYQSLEEDSQCPMNEKSLSLHNRLISQYKFFTGEEKMQISEYSIEGFDIEPSLDSSCLDNPKTLAYMLAVFHHFVNNVESSKKQIKMQKLKQSMRGVNVDKSYNIMDYLVEKINLDYVRCKSYSSFVEAEAELKVRLIHEFYEKYKLEKRNTLVDYNRSIAFFSEKLTNDLCLYSVEVGKLSPTFHAALFMDLCCWAILQFVIVGIIRNRQIKNKRESIEKLNTEIIMLMKQGREEKSLLKPDESPDEIMFKFFFYYYEKDRYLQDTKILSQIEKNREKRKNPSAEYSLIRFSPQRKTIQWQELLDLFSEGEPGKSLKSFKDSILKCHKGIFQFNKRSGRNLKPDPITLKAFYKEIYMDDTLYNSRKSMTIFHEFLKSKKMGNGDYYFIDEKINAGIFREYGIIDEFYAKNILHANLYNLICCFLIILNPAEMINKFKDALKNISAVIDEIYNGRSSVEESGTYVNPEEEEKLQSEISILIGSQKENLEKISYEDTRKVMSLCFKLYNLKFPDGEF